MKKKIFVLILSLILALGVSITAYADEDMDIMAEPRMVTSSSPIFDVNPGYVVDQAEILSDTEEKILTNKIEALRDSYQIDIVIVTAKGVDPDYRMAYADDFYDYNGYGYGDNNSGVLLLTNIMDDGSYERNNSWISTTGSCIAYFSDDDIQEIGADITPYLLSGDYYEAYDLYIDDCAKAIDYDITGNSIEKVGYIIGGILVVGLIGAWLHMSKLKRQLISVNDARDANDYLVENSMHIDSSYDLYLYSAVTKTAKPKESSSGSSTHSGSSGTSHGGGGF